MFFGMKTVFFNDKPVRHQSLNSTKNGLIGDLFANILEHCQTKIPNLAGDWGFYGLEGKSIVL